MIKAAGLQTHIWNNNLKSLALLAAYPFILCTIIWAAAAAYAALAFGFNSTGLYNAAPRPSDYAEGFIFEYWPIIVTGVIIWFTIAFFIHTKMVRALAKSHPVSRTDEPALYNMLENLCISQGMRMPALEIIETHARNAFASGINEKTFRITVTRGLMGSLAPDELEGVLAHELTHIQNRDVRLLIISIIFTGMIGFAAQMAWRMVRFNMFYSRRNRGKSGGGAILAIMAVIAILYAGYLATLFTRFALSRKREYMADAGAVSMTKNPDAMMRALMRISGKDHIPETTADIALMCIENAKPFMGLFATHPPIEKRIKALSNYTGTPVPVLEPLERDEDTQPLKDNWLTRHRNQNRRP